MTEKNTSHKKEVAQLKSTIDEKCAELDESLKRKEKLEVIDFFFNVCFNKFAVF